MTAPTSPLHNPAQPRPRNCADLFVSFTVLALQGFGGVLAVVQRELVEKKRWMTTEEFIEDWAVAQIMPGPNVVNLAVMIGDRCFGVRGALAALAGMLLIPMVLVLALAMLYGHFADNVMVSGALRGMAAVAAGLIAATGLKLLSALRHHPMGLRMCLLLALLTFCAIALWRAPLGWVLLVVGGVACAVTWTKLAP